MGIETAIGCHTFRATGITDYLTNGGRIGRTNKANQLGLLYELFRAYDKPDWIRAVGIAQEFHVSFIDLSTAYVKAVEWADLAAKA